MSGASCTIYPNPIWRSRPNGSNPPNVTIAVSGVRGKVKIAVVDMDGREINVDKLIVVGADTGVCPYGDSQNVSTCQHIYVLTVERLAQGAYFVRITGENVSMVRKLIVR